MLLKSARPIFFVFLILALASLACGIDLGDETQTAPPQPPTAEQQSVQPTEPEQVVNDSSGLTTFTDEDDLYAIEVPANWTYTHTVDEQDNFYYIDTFISPDEAAVIENIVYDDGKAVTGAYKSAFALFFLNNWYSNTGKEGDIRVSEDKIMEDGSERLTWTSRGGDYSGISFLESRGATTFLFFTVDWADDAEDQYIDILNAVIESYRIP